MMRECICSQCKNLKSVSVQPDINADDNNSVSQEITYECEYGYPDEQCETCETDECELTCEHFIPEQVDADLVKRQCASCGKELLLHDDDNDGDVYCFDCYLKR